MSNLLAEARDRAKAAGRTFIAAQRDERRLVLRFENGKHDVTLSEVCEAVRVATRAQCDAELAALALVQLERLLAP